MRGRCCTPSRRQLLAGVAALGGAWLLGPARAAEPALPRVAIDTALGRIVVELETKRAPLSAADFLRYVDKGLYNGAGFYRSVRRDGVQRRPRITAPAKSGRAGPGRIHPSR
jgi:hypothetical protein